MKNIIAGMTLFIGGVFVGCEAYKRLLLIALKDSNFTQKVADHATDALFNKYGEEKMKKIMDIITETEEK